MLSLIVARDLNGGIGKDNKLLCHLPEDLKRFKEITSGHTIIMGRNTFLSLPKVLPNRKHLVLSDVDLDCKHEDVVRVSDINELIKLKDEKEEYFVIGGGMVYKQLLPYCDKLYITQILENFNADTFFELDKENFAPIRMSMQNEHNGIKYRFFDFIRRNNQ